MQLWTAPQEALALLVGAGRNTKQDIYGLGTCALLQGPRGWGGKGAGQHVCSPHLALPRRTTPSWRTEAQVLCLDATHTLPHTLYTVERTPLPSPCSPTIAGSPGQVTPSLWALGLHHKVTDLGKCPLKSPLGALSTYVCVVG